MSRSTARLTARGVALLVNLRPRPTSNAGTPYHAPIEARSRCPQQLRRVEAGQLEAPLAWPPRPRARRRRNILQLRDDSDGDAQQQDQPARSPPRVSQAPGRSGDVEIVLISPHPRRTPSSGSRSACCWPRSPHTRSPGSTTGCARCRGRRGLRTQILTALRAVAPTDRPRGRPPRPRAAGGSTTVADDLASGANDPTSAARPRSRPAHDPVRERRRRRRPVDPCRGAGARCAEAGERVAVVEADLRRPPGPAPAGQSAAGPRRRAHGHAADREAIQSVSCLRPEAGLRAEAPPLPPPIRGRRHGRRDRWLRVGARRRPGRRQPCGAARRPESADLIRALAEDFDHVLVDAPSPLEVSDAMPLLARRRDHHRRTRRAHARDVGPATCGAAAADAERPGARRRRQRRLIGRDRQVRLQVSLAGRGCAAADRRVNGR